VPFSVRVSVTFGPCSYRELSKPIHETGKTPTMVSHLPLLRALTYEVIIGFKNQKVYNQFVLMVEKVVVGQLATNCYLVTDDKSRETLVIDPGDDAELIINRVRDLELKPKQIVVTHGHFDHLLAVNELKTAFEIPFLLSRKDEVMLVWFRKSTQHFVGFDPGPAPIVDAYLRRKIQVFDIKFKIIETPGHTPGGICLYLKEKNILFSGDTIFAEGAVGRTDYPYCNKNDLSESIKKLMRLPDDTLVYPGHGEETTIGQEKMFHRMQK